MRTISLFAFFTLLLSINASTQDRYYTGFIEKLGVDTHTASDGKDCTQLVASIVYDLRDTLINHSRDIESLLASVVDTIDKLKFEVSPECRTYYGDFGSFMGQYFGEIDDLRELALQNLDSLSFEIDSTLTEAAQNLDAREDDMAGSLHAHALRQFIGLEKKTAANDETTQETQEILTSDDVNFANEVYDGSIDYSAVENDQRLSAENEGTERVIIEETSQDGNSNTDDTIIEVDAVYVEPETVATYINDEPEDVYENNDEDQVVVTVDATFEQVPVIEIDGVYVESEPVVDYVSSEPTDANIYAEYVEASNTEPVTFESQIDYYPEDIYDDMADQIVVTVDATSEQIAVEDIYVEPEVDADYSTNEPTYPDTYTHTAESYDTQPELSDSQIDDPEDIYDEMDDEIAVTTDEMIERVAAEVYDEIEDQIAVADDEYQYDDEPEYYDSENSAINRRILSQMYDHLEL